MAQSPNTDPFNGYTTTWQQPYASFDQFWRGNSVSEIRNDRRVERELDRLEAVDKLVESQLTYDLADAIINKVKQTRGLEND
jgi:hypothetical protein